MLAEPVLNHLTVDRILRDLAAVLVVLVSYSFIPPHNPNVFPRHLHK